MENGHVTEVGTNGGRMVILQRGFNGGSGYVTEVVSLMEGERSCYSGQFNGGRIVMLRRWSV